MNTSETEELLFWAMVMLVWDVRVVERTRSSSLLTPLDSSVDVRCPSLLLSSTGLSLIVRVVVSVVDGFAAAMMLAVVEAAKPFKLSFWVWFAILFPALLLPCTLFSMLAFDLVCFKAY